MSMIIGNLKRIGVDPQDLIIVACDGRRSWRKDVVGEYKGTRKEKREKSGLDWDKYFKDFDILLEEIDIGTNWNVIKIDSIEADDIMAVASRFYNDREVILVTYDSDLEQCWSYENVKIFSPKSKKWKVKPEKFDPFLSISKKIQKEASDDLVSPVLNEEDYMDRMKCVNLLELPEWVEKTIRDKFEKLPESKVGRLKYISSPTIRDRLYSIFDDKSKIIDYQKQLVKEEKKKAKKKVIKKKVKEKNNV